MFQQSVNPYGSNNNNMTGVPPVMPQLFQQPTFTQPPLLGNMYGVPNMTSLPPSGGLTGMNQYGLSGLPMMTPPAVTSAQPTLTPQQLQQLMSLLSQQQQPHRQQ